jgi:hypothetical protein
MAKEEEQADSRYKICESIIEFDVEKEVNALIAEGWKPLGNLLVAVRKDLDDERENIHYIQAMIKE